MKDYYDWIVPNVECWVWIKYEASACQGSGGESGQYLQCIVEQMQKEKGMAKIRLTSKEEYSSCPISPIASTGELFECKFDRLMEREQSSEHNIHGYIDMVHMKYLNEAEILNNLKKRYQQNIIFTYIGPTLIVMNPYKDIENVQGNDVIDSIKKELGIVSVIDERSKPNKIKEQNIQARPHTYTVSGIAYKQMFANKKNQAIVISGESGAGKTENAKLSMQFLTSLSSNSQNEDDLLSQLRTEKTTNMLMEELKQFAIEVKILACNPILEAFGNAKTVRNNNSSRFGKYVKIYIDKISHNIQGASIDNYLLEKSRIPSPAKGERNYHIFYHMLKGNQDLTALRLSSYRTPADFEYLRKSDCYEVENIQDSKLYLEVKKAFRQMNVSSTEQDAIFSLLSAILLLGNANLDSSKSTDTQASTFLNMNLPTHSKEFKNVADLLQVNAKNLEEALVFKIRKVGTTIIKSPQSPEECLSMRDSLSKILYDSLFNFLVWKMNQSLLPPQDLMNKCLSIGLLDIFGFESFDLNSFEQLCINFTNEKFQQLYVQYVFKSEEDDYKLEGINDVFANLQYQENQFIIDTIEKKPTGIMVLLDENCSLGSGTDESFLNQIVKNHQKNGTISFPKKEKNSFCLSHTAKQVVYNVQGFRDKNKDEVSSEVEKCLSMSTCSTIASLLTFQQGEKVTLNTSKQEQAGQSFQSQSPSFKTFNNQKNEISNTMQSNPIQSNNQTKKTVKFLGQKFRQSLQELMVELNSSDVHFIRCIKPNEEKQRDLFRYDNVYQQVQYLGLLDSIKIRKFGYSYRMTYDNFFLEYQELGQKTKGLTLQKISQQKLNLKDLIISEIFEKTALLQKKGLPEKSVAFGKNKIFLKSEIMKILHEQIQEIITTRKTYGKKIIVSIQKYLFRKYFHINLAKIKQKLLKVQSFVKMFLTRKKFLQKKRAILKMKKFIRARQLGSGISAFRLNLIQYLWDMVSFMIFSKSHLQEAFQTMKYCQKQKKIMEQPKVVKVIVTAQAPQVIQAQKVQQVDKISSINISTQVVQVSKISHTPVNQQQQSEKSNNSKEQSQVFSALQNNKNQSQQIHSRDNQLISILNDINSSDINNQQNQSQFRTSRNIIPQVNFNNDQNKNRTSNAWRQTLVSNIHQQKGNKESAQNQMEEQQYNQKTKKQVSQKSLILKFTEYNPAYQYSEFNMSPEIDLDDVPQSEDFQGELDNIIEWEIINEIKRYDFFSHLSSYLAKRTKWGIQQSQEKIMKHQMKPISNPLTNINDLKNIITYEDTKEAIRVIRSIAQQNTLNFTDSSPVKRQINFEDAQSSKSYKMQISTASSSQSIHSKVSLMNPRKASVRDVNSLNLIIQKQKTLTKAIKNKKYTPSEKAVNIFKTMLKCTGERKSRFNRHTNITKLLTLCNEESIDMKEENGKRESRIKYLKLFAIISSIMPTTSRFFYPLLNFLYTRISLASQDEDEKKWYQYCFLRLYRSEQIQRGCIPTDTEIVMIENKKQILIRVYLLNEVPITIGVESYTSVRMLKQELLKRIGVKDRHECYGLMEVRNNIKKKRRESRFIDESERVMDVIAFWEGESNLFGSQLASSGENSNSHRHNDDINDFNVQNYQELDGLKIYLGIRLFFSFQENDKEAISIFYSQVYSEVQASKFSPLEEIDYLNLAGLQLCIDYPRGEILKEINRRQSLALENANSVDNSHSVDRIDNQFSASNYNENQPIGEADNDDEEEDEEYEEFVANRKSDLYLDASFYIPSKIYYTKTNDEWQHLILQNMSSNRLIKKQYSPLQAKLAYILYLAKQDFFMSTTFRDVRYQRIKLKTLNDTLSSKEKYEQMIQTEQSLLTPIKDDILLAVNPSNLLMCDSSGLHRPKRRVQIRNIQKFCCTDKEVIVITHDNSKHIFETITHCREITFLIRQYLRLFYEKQQKQQQEQSYLS